MSITVHSEEETINMLIAGSSIARYGDGEIDLAYGVKKEVFENEGAELSNRLREILTTTQKELLIGVPNIFSDEAKQRLTNPDFWSRYEPSFQPYLESDQDYYSAFISRPDNFSEIERQTPVRKKSVEHIRADFWAHLRQIWDHKRVGIVHFHPRMTEHELYLNAASRVMINCPQRGAWKEYSSILEQCLVSSADVFLISAGPVACVLASDLCAEGRQAIDIGQAPRVFSQWKGEDHMVFY